MKEAALAIYKGLCFNMEFHPKSQIAGGSFKTIPNPLRQLPAKNLIIPEASLKSICLILKYYKNSKFPTITCLNADNVRLLI